MIYIYIILNRERRSIACMYRSIDQFVSLSISIDRRPMLLCLDRYMIWRRPSTIRQEIRIYHNRIRNDPPARCDIAFDHVKMNISWREMIQSTSKSVMSSPPRIVTKSPDAWSMGKSPKRGLHNAANAAASARWSPDAWPTYKYIYIYIYRYI